MRRHPLSPLAILRALELFGPQARPYNQTGPAARLCRVTVPGEVLREGCTYAWYITARTADGRTAFAPSEGVFRTTGEG
jgi:hypothetical protein